MPNDDRTDLIGVRPQARALVYVACQDADAPSEERWRVWSPSLPEPFPEGRGTSPVRALFAAHRAVRRLLHAHPEPSEARTAFRLIQGHCSHDRFEAVTGEPLTARTDPELIVFATLFSNALHVKELSRVLATHGYPRRWAAFVAKHLRPDTIELDEVRYCLARLPSTPHAALSMMAARAPTFTTLDAMLLRNPAVTRTIVERIARLEGSDAAVLAHPLLPVSTLRRRYSGLASNDLRRNKETLKAIARHPRCPVDIVTELALHPDVFVRAQVAARPELPPTLRKTLASDESPRVRAVLASDPWPPPRKAPRRS